MFITHMLYTIHVSAYLFCLASGGTILLQVVIRESNSCLRSVYLIDVKTWAFREERHINQIQLLADVSTTELITYNLLLYVCTKTWGIFMPSHRLSGDRLIRQTVHTKNSICQNSYWTWGESNPWLKTLVTSIIYAVCNPFEIFHI